MAFGGCTKYREKLAPSVKQCLFSLHIFFVLILIPHDCWQDTTKPICKLAMKLEVVIFRYGVYITPEQKKTRLASYKSLPTAYILS